MTNENRSARDDAIEAELKAIIKQPQLASEAFPDPEVRENIVPLIEYFRRSGVPDQMKNSKES